MSRTQIIIKKYNIKRPYPVITLKTKNKIFSYPSLFSLRTFDHYKQNARFSADHSLFTFLVATPEQTTLFKQKKLNGLRQRNVVRKKIGNNRMSDAALRWTHYADLDAAPFPQTLTVTQLVLFNSHLQEKLKYTRQYFLLGICLVID